jgi:GxxExxY protein
MDENEIAREVVDICFRIHKEFGPGLFESVYEELFCFELNKRGLSFDRQKGISLIYEDVNMGLAFIPDVVVGNKVIVEFKSVEKLADVHYKQVLTYLRIADLRLGLLINFNENLIKNGIHRIANAFY